MGIFDGIAEAKAGGEYGDYERGGHYLQRIDALKTGKSRKGAGFFVVEKTIIHVFDDDDGKGHRIGEEVSHMIMVGDYFLRDIKRLVVTILECDDDEISPAQMEALCAGDQPLAGMIVECKNRMVKTKADKDFTKIKYVGSWTPEEAAEVLDAELLARKNIQV